MTLLLKNAHIVSGTEGEPFRGDILIHGDTISAIGNLGRKKTARTIDCQGAYVAPGFIDAFSRADQYLNIVAHAKQDHALEMGVSSVVAGYEGRGIAPLIGHGESVLAALHPARGVNIDWHTMRELSSTLARLAPGVHFNTLIGYQALRNDVLRVHGENMGTAQVRALRAVIASALREGALGVSLDASAISAAEETMIHDVVGEHSRVLALHAAPTMAKDKKKLESLIARGARVVISHALPAWTGGGFLMKARVDIEALASIGCYFILPPSEFIPLPIASLLPDWAKEEGGAVALEKLHDDWLSKKILAEIPDLDPKEMQILHAPHHGSVVGLTLHDFMENHDIKNVKDGILKLMKTTGLRAFVKGADPENATYQALLKHPQSLVGSLELGSYPTHWRDIESKGGFLKLLFDIESRGTMPLAAFIRKITHTPAEVFGIKDRGAIAEGMKADIVGFKNKELKFMVVDGRVRIS